MGCRLLIRRIGCGLSILLAAMQIGCAGPEADRSPSELLSVASAGLEGVDRYTFRSRTAVLSGGVELHELESYEGEIAGHAVRAVRGLSGGLMQAADAVTPASRLAELAGKNAGIAYAGEAAEGCVALRVRLSGEEAARDAKARLRRQFERAAERAKSELAGGRLWGGEAASADEFRRALEWETKRFRRELDRMLEGLEAETTVLVTIDRRVMLPLEIEEKTVLRYESGGRSRTEEQVTRTTLDGFDGKPSSS